MTAMTWATLAASTAAKYAAVQKSNSAMESVQNMEAARQKKLREEADAALNTNIDKSGVIDVNTEIDAEKGKRVADLNNAVATNQGGPGGPETGLQTLGVSAQNKLVQSDTGARASEGAAQTKSLANAMASMGGFKDTMLNTGMRNVRGLQEQGRLGNFMAGSSGAAGVENEFASHAGDNMKTIGDILGAVSVLSGGYAANGTTPWMTATEKAQVLADQAAKVAAGTATTTAGTVANAAANTAPLFGLFTKPKPGPWKNGYVMPPRGPGPWADKDAYSNGF